MKCPCLHSDPRIPDCAPGKTQRLRGWPSFYEGEDVQRFRASITVYAQMLTQRKVAKGANDETIVVFGVIPALMWASKVVAQDAVAGRRGKAVWELDRPIAKRL